jgi:FAD/FMN-containing dehydrogenase
MDIHSLRQTIRGTVIAREDAGYDEARHKLLWNGRKPPRYPQVIVRAASVEDVQAAVRFAAAQGRRVSVRGGGHHWSGIALQDGVVLDLSALNHVAIDPQARIAEVGPTVTNGDMARALGAHGLAFPLGHCATVPLSGYLLGGGFGWNSGAWGIACFGVDGVEVVTADGEVRRASAAENPDIFWAVRGAGPEFFGVVTAYRLRLQPLPRAITTGVWTYPLEDIGDVGRWASASMEAVPRNVEFTVMMSSAPPPLAGKAAKVATGIATVFADTEAEARSTLSQIAAGAPAGALDVQQNLPTPFETLYGIIAQFFPEGRRYAVDTFWGSNASDGFLGRLAGRTGRAPSPESFSLAVVLPPSASGAGQLPDAAYSAIGPVFGCAYAIWQDPSQDEANTGWLKETARMLAPASTGHYLGEADLDEPGRIRGCFSAQAWARLKALQAQYDPVGLFRAHRPASAPLEPVV